jgi:hypothetical protein
MKESSVYTSVIVDSDLLQEVRTACQAHRTTVQDALRVALIEALFDEDFYVPPRRGFRHREVVPLRMSEGLNRAAKQALFNEPRRRSRSFMISTALSKHLSSSSFWETVKNPKGVYDEIAAWK